jgi:hypothetical protein
MVEGVWKDDELNGYAKIQFYLPDLPKPLDPKQATTMILGYSGYLKKNRLDGKGVAVL